LLSILLSGTDSEQAKSLVSLSAFRPGIFSDFLFEVEISPPDCKVSLEEIQVQVTFEAESAPTDEMLRCVDNNLRMAIPLMIFLAVPADSNRPISESGERPVYRGLQASPYHFQARGNSSTKSDTPAADLPSCKVS
jgi:hypothetical protein